MSQIQPIIYTELNAFCLAILVLIFINIHRRRDQMVDEERLFLLLVYSDALILILDSAMWLLDGQAGDAMRGLYSAVTVVYYAMNPVICLIWYLYVDYQIYSDFGHIKKILLPISVPAAANLVLSAISALSGAMFYLDESNAYHRGKYFAVMALISFFYLACAWVLTLVKRRRIPKQDFYPITVFMILPVIGGVIQSLFYGVSLLWACATIAILIVFIHIQNLRLYTDYLTGLYNRRQLDRFLHQKVESTENGLLAGLMIDIDDFKNINDRFGHSTGDLALVDTSEILKRTFRKNDFIARYGGDEFVIVMAIQEKSDLQKAIDRLSENVASFNVRKTAPYTISLSVGYDCFFDQKDTSAKEFISRLDNLMYKNKHGNLK